MRPLRQGQSWETDMTTVTVEPCRAGFGSCDAMRQDEVRRHPRTPAVRDCRHMPIPSERPDRLQGPEVGTLCLYQSRYQAAPMVVRVLERSYVWAPGDPGYSGGARRYDWKVIARGPNGTRTLCVDDKDLVPLAEGMTFSDGPRSTTHAGGPTD
jgi:hypothetical protein